MIADFELSFADPQQIRRRQEQLLAAHVDWALRSSAFYRQRFADARLEGSSIRSYDDLLKLPLTTKADLEQCEESFLCIEPHEIADICLTSGTTGQPVSFYQSAADLERLAANEALAFRTAGVGAGDRVLIAAAIDRCFMAGMAYFLGVQKIGATAIRGGSSSVGGLAQLIQRFRPTAVMGVPTLILAVARYLQAHGVEPARCGIQRILCIGEPVRTPDLTLSALGLQLETLWQAHIYGTYASTEMATTFCDCGHGQGGHLVADLMMLEVLDEQGQRVADGMTGEVVATPLQVSAMPLLRFCTGDIATLFRQPCLCGRNSWRLGPVLGRKNQMLKYRGTTVYPAAIFEILQQLPGVTSYYLEVYDHFALSDRIKVVVGCAAPTHPQQIAELLAARIRVKPEVEIADPDVVQRRTVQEGKRKPVTFFDYRTRRASY